MTWKIVNISDTGTASKFGANDTDKINNMFAGVDVDDVRINVDWAQDKPIDLKEITEPSSPASGYLRLFADSTLHKVCVKKSDGSVIILW